MTTGSPANPPVLEVVTRHLPTRVRAFARMRDSLRGLGPAGWMHTVMVDEEHRGLAWANEWFRTVEPQAEWIWLVDDDDLVCHDWEFVPHLAALPPTVDLVVVCVHHGRRIGILPRLAVGGPPKLPSLYGIGGSNLVLRADLYRRTRHAWTGDYRGDYAFIREAWGQAQGVGTYPRVMMTVTRNSHGDPTDVEE